MPDNKELLNKINNLNETDLQQIKEYTTQVFPDLTKPESVVTPTTSKYDVDFLVPEKNKLEALNENRAQRQSTIAKLSLGVPRALGKAATELLKTPGYLYGLGEAALTEKGIGESLNNSWVNNLEKLDQSIKDELPVYMPKAVREGNILDNLSSSSFWATEGADGVGFVLSMLLPGQVAKLAKVGRLAELGINTASKLDSRIGNVKLLAKEAGQFTDELTAASTNAALEASSEALDTYKTVLDRTGDKQKAGEAASDVFKGNMALLVVPNLIDQYKLFGTFKKGAKESSLNRLFDKSGALVDDVKPLTKVELWKNYGKEVGSAFAREGLFEEGLQYSLQKEAQESTDGSIFDKAIRVGEKYLQGLSDVEFQKAVMLGGILGSPIGIIAARGKNKAEEELLFGSKDKTGLKDLLNSNFLERYKNFNQIYDTDEKGELKVNPEKLDKFKKDVLNQSITELIKDKALQNNDKETYNLYKDLEDFKYFLPYFQNEGGIEVLKEHINQLAEKDKQYQEDVLGVTDEKGLIQTKFELQNKAEQFKKIYDNTINSSQDIKVNHNPSIPIEATKYKGFIDKVVNRKIQEALVQHNLGNSINKLNLEITELELSPIYQNKKLAEDKKKTLDTLQKGLEQSYEVSKKLDNNKDLQEAFDEEIKQEYLKAEQPVEETKSVEVKETTIQDIPEVDYNEFVNTGNISPIHLETIATKIQNTTPLTDKEKAVFKTKSKEVEKILSDRTKPKETKTSTEKEVNIIEDKELQTKNGVLYDEDSAKAETPFKSAGQHYIDTKDSVLNPDETQQRWFNYLQKGLDLDIHRLLVVTPQNNPELFNSLVPEDKYKIGGKEFVNGIYVVLIDDNNNQIKVDGKPVYTTLENPDTERGKELLKYLSTQRRARSEGGLTEEEASIILEEEIKELKALRTKLLNTKEKYYLEIKTQEFGPRKVEKNGKDRVRGKVIGRISNNLSNLTLEVGKSSTSKYATLTNGTNVWSGKLYVIDNETGRTYDLQPRTLNSSEVDLTAKLLQTIVNKEGKLKILGKNNPISVLRDLIYLDAENPNEEYRIGLNKNKELVIGNSTYKTITPEVLDLLKTKLANKYLQFNAKIPQDNLYTEYKIDSTGKIFTEEWDSYKKYLLNNDDIPFGTDVVKIEEGQPKYTNPYLTFNSNPRLIEDVIKKEELTETPFGDYETQLEEGVIITLKPKRVKKGEKIDRETLLQKNIREGKNVSENVLKLLAEKLSKRTNIKFNIVNDPSQQWRGKVNEDGSVSLNTVYANLDTPFHEFFHPIIEDIKRRNTIVYDNLLKELKSNKQGQEILDYVNEEYPELSEDARNTEAIVQIIGELAADNINPETGKGLISAIKRLLRVIGNKLRNLFGIGDTIDLSDENLTKFTLQNFADLISLGESKINIFSEQDVPYKLKVVQSLQSDKAIKFFNNNKSLLEKQPEVFYTKLQSDLQIPKEQVNLLKDIKLNKKSGVREQFINYLLNELSYTVAIDTTKKGRSPEYTSFNIDNNRYSIDVNEYIDSEGDHQDVTTYLKNNEKITFEEYQKAFREFGNIKSPSQYYSNLTVPGGTNYTENEIKTPDITPFIKGHAQFSTNQGIGWFRSDEQGQGKQILSPELQKIIDKEGGTFAGKDYTENSKIRRILEVQSDLFQKGRNDKDLLAKEVTSKYNPATGWADRNKLNQKESGNQFLQLLNKDNNWVTFFIKSIIQDSNKKGYEKVLFPTGNTASKVEGHSTIEEFKREKEYRISYLNEQIDKLKELNINSEKENKEYIKIYGNPNETGRWDHEFFDNENSILANEGTINSFNVEIKQLKEEIENVDKEGFGALRPIYNFYENTVKNILKKNYKLNEVTDEYGNTWNEVELTPETKKVIFLQKVPKSKQLSRSQTKVLKGDYEFDKNTIDGISALFTNKLIEQGFSPNDLLRFKDLEAKLLDQVYDELIEVEESKPTEDLTYILDNWEDVTKRFSKHLELYSVKLTPKVKVKEVTEIKEDESTPVNQDEEDTTVQAKRAGESYNESANTTSTKDTMSGTSKWLIYSLPQLDKQGNQEYNELGLPKLVDFNNTYNFLLNHLAGIVGFDNKYNAIVKLGLTNPIYKELANRLKNPNDILTYEQLMLQMQFNQDFNKNKFESYITIVDGDVIKTFSANSSNLQDKIKTKWQSNIRDASKYVTEKDGKFIISNDITKDRLSPINFLKALGITFSEPTLKYFKDNKYQIPELNDAVNYITQEIEKTYQDEELTNGIVNLYSGSSKGRIDALLELETQFTDETIELSFSSTEGKTIYQISLHNFLSLTSSAINTSKTRDELFAKMPHLNTINTQHSLYLNTLFTKDGKKRVIGDKPIQINVDLLDGLKDSGEGLQSTKLSTGDKIVQDLNVLLTTGKTPYLRAADKSTEHAISLSQFTSTTTNKNVLPVSLESLTKGFENSTIDKLFKGYFIDEIKSMRALIIDGLGNNVDIYRTKGKEFRIFEGILSQETKNEIDNSNLLKIDNDGTPVILDSDVDRVISTLTDSVLQDVYSFLEDYNKENIKLFKEYKVEDKVSQTLTDKNNKETLYRAFTVNDFINSIEQVKLFTSDLAYYKDFYKRTSAFTGTKKYADNSPSTNKQLNSIIKRSDAKLANGIINVAVFEDSKQKSNYVQEYTDALLATGISEDKAREILSAYTSMDEGDAQGWIILDEFREFLIRVGDFKPQQNKIFDKAIKGETLTPDEIYYFQTLKAQYSGPQVYNDLFVPAFHKFSLMPLIPSMIKGTNLEKLNNTMKEQKIGYALFKTGSKVGTLVDNNGKANPFYSNYTHGDITSKIDNIQKVSYDYLGIQLDINPVPKDKNIYGTQFRKLVLSNLAENGIFSNDKFKDVNKEYNQIITELTERAKERLHKELGFLHKDKYDNRDITKLVETLQKAAEDRSLPDNLIDAIQTQVIEGKVILKYPLDALVTKSKVESMLMSLINSNIIRQKVAGDAMIQGASSGFETVGTRIEGSNKKTLAFYTQDKDGKTLPMEVKVPLTNHYKGLLEHYGTIDNINKAIKEKTIDKRLIEMVGYRIPTQGLNSIEYMTIKEFLPIEASNLIILPTEIVAKSGGDYDIDKLNVIRPSFSVNAETKEITYNEIGDIKTSTDNTLVNRLIELTKEVVSDESNFIALITPNSVANLKRLVQEIRELRGEPKEPKISSTTELLKYGYKLDQFTFFLSGKAGVGIAAVQNTHHILSQIGGLYVDKKFAEDVFIEAKKDSDGNLLLGNIENLKGDKISDLISEFINAYVDIAKDPFVFSLNATTKAAGVWFYLTRIGADFDTIAYFMNQPIISEYLKAEAINESLSVKNSDNYLYKPELKKLVESKYANNLKKLKGEFLTSKDYKTYSTKDNDTLKDYIKDKPNTVEFNQAQLQFLDNYLTYQKHARMLSNAANAVNSDTAGVGKDLDASQDKLNQFKEVDIEKFIPNWRNAMDNSFVKAFNQHEYSIDVYKDLQLTQEENINKTIRNITEGIQTFKAADKDKINSLVRNDFISYLLQNYSSDNNGKLLSEYRDILFKRDNSLAKRLLNLKQKSKTELTESEKLILDNKFIQELFPILNQGNERTDNIKIFTKRLDTFTSNLFTQEFRKLEELAPATYRNLVRLGILQSGLNNSPITYLGLIPYETYGDMVNDAIDNFNKKNGVENLYKFKQLFYRNNYKGILPNFKNNYTKFNRTTGQFERVINKKAIILPNLGNYIFGKDYNIEKYIIEPIEKTENPLETIKQENKEELDLFELKPGIFANEDQKIAIKNIKTFLNSKESYFLLEGGAGTGKTTTINKAIEDFKGKIIGATVSDEARSVLQVSMIGKQTNTIASLLGLVADISTGNLIFRERNEFEEEKFRQAFKVDPIETAKLVIIDEASMIDVKSLNLIRKLKPKDTKIIFMGDRTQLPPIGETISPVFKEITDNYNKLEKVERFKKDAPIFQITNDLFADNINNYFKGEKLTYNPLDSISKTDIISDSELVLFRKNSDQLSEDIKQDFIKAKKDKNLKHVVLIADRNIAVTALNKKVRNSIFNNPSEQYLKGELITFREPLVYNKAVLVENNVKGIIKDIKEVTHYGIPAYKIDLILNKINIQGKLVEIEQEVYVPVDKDSLKLELDKLAKIARVTKKWQDFFSFKEAFANIDYGYAMTTHKIQGSTYNTVYVFVDDVYRDSNPRKPLEINQMMRTATSRPTTKLVLVKSDYNNINSTDVKFEKTEVEESNIIEQGIDNEPSTTSDLQELEKSINFNDKIKPWINSLELNLFGIENTEQLIQELKEAKTEEDLAKIIKKICG